MRLEGGGGRNAMWPKRRGAVCEREHIGIPSTAVLYVQTVRAMERASSESEPATPAGVRTPLKHYQLEAVTQIQRA